MNRKIIVILALLILITGCALIGYSYTTEFERINKLTSDKEKPFSPEVEIIYNKVFSELVINTNPHIHERITTAIKQGMQGSHVKERYQVVSKLLRAVFYRELRNELSKLNPDKEKVIDLYNPLRGVVDRRKSMSSNPESFVKAPDILLRKGLDGDKESLKKFELYMDQVFMMSLVYELAGYEKAKAENNEDKIDLKALEASLYSEYIRHRFSPEKSMEISAELNDPSVEDIKTTKVISIISETFPKAQKYFDDLNGTK